MTLEDVLYRAHYLRIEEEVHALESLLRREQPHAEIKHLMEKAYNQIIHNMEKDGILETLAWESSSMIRSTTYNSEKEVLLVEFLSGGEYSYAGVTPQEYADFKAADSKGQHFIRNIRNQKTFEKHEAQKD